MKIIIKISKEEYKDKSCVQSDSGTADDDNYSNNILR